MRRGDGGRPSRELQGLFFRPMRRKWVERTATGQWRAYFAGSSKGLNMYAASKTAYLGMYPIFFAAR